MIEVFKKIGASASIIIFAAILRVIFIFGAEPTPVMWDARIYSSAAIGVLHYFDNLDQFGHAEKMNSADSAFYLAQFDLKMKQSIQGEQIDWLYYSVPDIRKAQDYLFISGPIYPAILATIFSISPGHDFTVVRVFNILIDLIILFLLMLISLRLFNRATSIIAGLIYSLYLPFIFFTGLISPDTLTSLFTILTLYLILKFNEGRSGKYLYLIGFLLGVMALTRATATLIFIPFVAGFVYDQRDDVRQMAISIGKALVPFVIVILPWVILASLHYDQLAFRDPGYSEANFRSSSSIINEGYDLDYAKKDFWTASVSESILSDLPGYSKLLMKKFVRLWGNPYNDYRRTFVMSPGISEWFHIWIVLLGLWGISAAFALKKKGLLYLLAIPAYYTLLHIIFHSLARYNYNSMAVVIIAASFALFQVYEHLKSKSMIHYFRLLSVMTIGVGFVLYTTGENWAAVLGPEIGPKLLYILKLTAIIVLLAIIFKRLIGSMGKKLAIRVALVPSVLLLMLFVILGYNQSGWAGWKSHLDESSKLAGIKIYPPKDFRLQPGEIVRVCLDLTTNKELKNPTQLFINGKAVEVYLNRPPYDIYYTRKTTYPVFDKILDYGKERFRGWRYIPLNSDVFNDLMNKYGVIDIGVKQADKIFEPEAFIDIYGTYLTDEDSLYMPSITRSSIERFVEKRRASDPRIWSRYKISSDSTISYYIDNIDRPDAIVDDLSEQVGTQTGRYRIFLEVRKQNETSLYF